MEKGYQEQIIAGRPSQTAQEVTIEISLKEAQVSFKETISTGANEKP